MTITAKVDTETPRRLQERSIITRNKLLDAALDAFSERGFEGTSTREIADRANVHHPLITYHFDNKLTLWKGAVDRAFADIMRDFALSLDAFAGRPTGEQLENLIRVYVVFAASHPQLHRIIVHESAHPGERLDWLAKRYLRPLYENSRVLIVKGQSEGLVIPGEPALIYNLLRMAGSALFAVSHEVWLTTRLAVEDPKVIDELIDQLTILFLPGFRH
jgi:AcrR family transcriptional regulator